MPTEDDVFKAICEERDAFHRDGPAKSLDQLWQRKAAQRIMGLFAPREVPRQPFIIEDD